MKFLPRARRLCHLSRCHPPHAHEGSPAVYGFTPGYFDRRALESRRRTPTPSMKLTLPISPLSYRQPSSATMKYKTFLRFLFVVATVFVILFTCGSQAVATTAIRTDYTFYANAFAGTDSSTEEVDIQFDIDCLQNGGMSSIFYLTHNGYVVRDDPDYYYNLNGLISGLDILAPFMAHVDDDPLLGVTHGGGYVDGHLAYAFNWIDVGYYDFATGVTSTKRNSFQLVIIDRSDTGAGNFDFEFNYDNIDWETADDDGGVSGLGSLSALTGWQMGAHGESYLFTGSRASTGSHPTNDNHPFLDTNTTGTALVLHSLNSEQAGRYVFKIRNPSQIFWLGQHASDNDWDAENWASEFFGPISSIPVPSSDVVFSATSGVSDQNSTTLPEPFPIHSLTVRDANGMTVSGFSLHFIHEAITAKPSGIFQTISGGTVTINSDVYLSDDSVIDAQSTDDDVVIAGNIFGPILRKLGPGNLDLSGSVLEAGMVLDVQQGTVILSESQSLAAIHIAGGATLKMAMHSPGTPKTIDTYDLDIDSGGTLDLGVDQLVLRASGSGEHAANIAKIRALILAASDYGAWDMPGLTSSKAEDDAGITGSIGLMMSDNAWLNYGCFGTAHCLDDEDYFQVLVKTTYMGDYYLDGSVDLSDYGLAGFIITEQYLEIGDINWDDAVDVGEYGVMDYTASVQWVYGAF